MSDDLQLPPNAPEAEQGMLACIMDHALIPGSVNPLPLILERGAAGLFFDGRMKPGKTRKPSARALSDAELEFMAAMRAGKSHYRHVVVGCARCVSTLATMVALTDDGAWVSQGHGGRCCEIAGPWIAEQYTRPAPWGKMGETRTRP